MASIMLTIIGSIDYLAYGNIFTHAMFRQKKGDVFTCQKFCVDDRREVAGRQE
jgi:hypothetical protein